MATDRTLSSYAQRCSNSSGFIYTVKAVYVKNNISSQKNLKVTTVFYVTNRYNDVSKFEIMISRGTYGNQMAVTNHYAFEKSK